MANMEKTLRILACMYSVRADPLLLEFEILKIKDIVRFNSAKFNLKFKLMTGSLSFSFNGMFSA